MLEYLLKKASRRDAGSTAILATASGVMNDRTPTTIQLIKAAVGPPVILTKTNNEGIADRWLIVVNVAVKFSKGPRRVLP
jgi:hypothetical protein